MNSESKIFEPRISIITLGVSDMADSIRFYRDGLKFPTKAADGAEWAIFRTSGTRFALYPRDKLAADIGSEFEPDRRGFAGGAWLLCIAHRSAARCNIKLR